MSHALFNARTTCKKSPQTWGLKGGLSVSSGSKQLLNLQKESPNMGIERTLVANILLASTLVLQKESPNMGIESLNATLHVVGGCLYLQKESPNMGIERFVT